jgi:cation transport ATPase
MPIQVTCGKCLTRFSVNEKFAGKKGPCPKCKAEITIPKLEEQVVVHVPDDGPKDSKGRSVLKPIKRTETEVTRRGIIIAVTAVLGAILFAIAMRMNGGTPIVARVLVALLLAPPLVWVGYTITRDSELEPYTGQELWTRVAIVSAIFAALWLVYVFIPPYVLDLDYASEMGLMSSGITLVTMIGLGAITATLAFELEFIGGLTIAGIYFAPTLLLAILGAVPLVTT